MLRRRCATSRFIVFSATRCPAMPPRSWPPCPASITTTVEDRPACAEPERLELETLDDSDLAGRVLLVAATVVARAAVGSSLLLSLMLAGTAGAGVGVAFALFLDSSRSSLSCSVLGGGRAESLVETTNEPTRTTR